jgi:hypothetical protein
MQYFRQARQQGQTAFVNHAFQHTHHPQFASPENINSSSKLGGRQNDFGDSVWELDNAIGSVMQFLKDGKLSVALKVTGLLYKPIVGYVTGERTGWQSTKDFASGVVRLAANSGSQHVAVQVLGVLGCGMPLSLGGIALFNIVVGVGSTMAANAFVKHVIWRSEEEEDRVLATSAAEMEAAESEAFDELHAAYETDPTMLMTDGAAESVAEKLRRRRKRWEALSHVALCSTAIASMRVASPAKSAATAAPA